MHVRASETPAFSPSHPTPHARACRQGGALLLPRVPRRPTLLTRARAAHRHHRRIFRPAASAVGSAAALAAAESGARLVFVATDAPTLSSAVANPDIAALQAAGLRVVVLAPAGAAARIGEGAADAAAVQLWDVAERRALGRGGEGGEGAAAAAASRGGGAVGRAWVVEEPRRPMVEQQLCASAAHFVGTLPSTFSLSITLERDARGLPRDTLSFWGLPRDAAQRATL